MNLLFPEPIAQRSAGVQLLYLFFIIIVCLGVGQMLGIAIVMLSGYPLEQLAQTDWQAADPALVRTYKVAQIVSSVVTLLLPAYLYSLAQSGNTHFLRLHRQPTPTLLGLSLLVMMAAVPALGWVMEQNQAMQLPAALAPIETWMRQSETQLADLTAVFLQMNNVWELLLNMLMIAVLPALGEELLFRGSLQPTLMRYVRNPHVAIWLTAILFSSLHLQFYGFVPRCLLGALFGYFYYWTNNLWYPIVAHFANNGLQVLAVYSGAVAVSDIDTSDQHLPLAAVLASAVLTVGLLQWYSRQAKEAVAAA